MDESFEQDVLIRQYDHWINSKLELFDAGVMQYDGVNGLRLRTILKREIVQIFKIMIIDQP